MMTRILRLGVFTAYQLLAVGTRPSFVFRRFGYPSPSSFPFHNAKWDRILEFSGFTRPELQTYRSGEHFNTEALDPLSYAGLFFVEQRP